MLKVLKVHATCWILHPAQYITWKYPMSKVLKEIKNIFKQIQKATFKTFTSHVQGVEGSVHIH